MKLPSIPSPHHLSQTGTQLTVRQFAERIGIGQHALRLMERADQILAARVVHGCLSAHRRIDLSQQCGRYLHEIDATLPGCSGKAAHVADNTAT